MPLPNGLDNRLITSSDLQQYFVSKSNGEANAGGIIRFWKDDNRTEPKLVYELVQDINTQNYSYVPLPNPLTLSGVGTVVDTSNNDIPIYWFPYDGTPDASFGNLELYYVEVFDANNQLQFTREAWPWPLVEGGQTSPTVSSLGIVNQLTNPQFTKVLFQEGSTLTIHVVGNATTNVDIAPGWTLSIQHSTDGDVTVQQLPIMGTQHYPSNPPFTLKVGGNSTVQKLELYQQLNNNPDWAAPATSGSADGFLSGSIMLAPLTGVEMLYVPNGGNTEQPILDITNNTGVYAQFQKTIKLQPSNNPNNGITGNDRIVIRFENPTGTSEISNVQVVPLTSLVEDIPFEQTTANRQLDQMFNYYKAGLDFKPIPSYLVGWDFPLNPAQFLGSTIVPTAGASKYVWDQTIMFQSVDNGIKVDRSPSGTLLLQAIVDSKVAIIQYLSQTEAREILTNPLSSMLTTHSAPALGIAGTISLWYTTDATLPLISANNSIVKGLDANGKPNDFNGTWVEVPRSNLGDAQFLSPLATSNDFSHIGFSGWDSQGAGVTTATFFAIVVGTGLIAAGNTFVVQSVSLAPGSVPTIPAPQSQAQVLLECQQYYWKTFVPGVTPGNTLGYLGTLSWRLQGNSSGVDPFVSGYDLHVRFPVPMIRTPTMTSYNPVSNNSTWFNKDRNLDSGTASYDSSVSRTGFGVINTLVPGDASSQTCYIHISADAKLGT